MRAKNKKDTAGDSDGAGNTIEDPRFSNAHVDPRFRRAPRHKTKVAIDSRFDGVFTDKRFATSSAPVDKRGKPKKASENALRRYYHLEDEEDKNDFKNKVRDARKKKLKAQKKEEEEESSGDEKAVAELSESPQSKLEAESDDSSAATTSAESSSDEDEVDSEDGDFAEVEDVPLIEKETNRLAVVNMDWSQVKAVDLFVMLNSCLPKGINGGQIKSVSVYPSEFGLKRMEEEAVHGPVALFEDDKGKMTNFDDDDDDDNDDDDDDDVDEIDPLDDEIDAGIDDYEIDKLDDLDDDEIGNLEDEGEDEVEDEVEDEGEDEDEDEGEDEIDTEKVRAYEKSKLRYYYAVVECDSVATADYLYKNCDGVEFERSSNVLDLRFIPDSMEFKHPPRDVATETPANYEGLDFQTRALQQSNAVLSWDDDEPHRVKTLRRKFSEKQLAELDLKEFLASSESDSETNEDENGIEDPLEKKKKKHEKYRSLLLSGNGSEREDEDDDEGQDMEVTFNTGLEEISKKILEKKDKGSETVWEAYLRKKKEKKKARKHGSKNSSDDDSDGSDYPAPAAQKDDFFEEEPSVQETKKIAKGKKKREENKPVEEKETKASRAELELLLADEDGADKKVKGYKIKQKKTKGKKGEQAPDEAKLPTVDLDDPRFSALFNNPGFALDPTEPQFQRSATYFRQLAQKQHKNHMEDADVEPIEPPVQKEEKHSVSALQKEKHELSSIVKSLKLKSQQLPLPSSVKTKKDKMESRGSASEKKKRKLSSSDRTMKKKARE